MLSGVYNISNKGLKEVVFSRAEGIKSDSSEKKFLVKNPNKQQIANLFKIFPMEIKTANIDFLAEGIEKPGDFASEEEINEYKAFCQETKVIPFTTLAITEFTPEIFNLNTHNTNRAIGRYMFDEQFPTGKDYLLDIMTDGRIARYQLEAFGENQRTTSLISELLHKGYEFGNFDVVFEQFKEGTLPPKTRNRRRDPKYSQYTKISRDTQTEKIFIELSDALFPNSEFYTKQWLQGIFGKNKLQPLQVTTEKSPVQYPTIDEAIATRLNDDEESWKNQPLLRLEEYFGRDKKGQGWYIVLHGDGLLTPIREKIGKHHNSGREITYLDQYEIQNVLRGRLPDKRRLAVYTAKQMESIEKEGIIIIPEKELTNGFAFKSRPQDGKPWNKSSFEGALAFDTLTRARFKGNSELAVAYFTKLQERALVDRNYGVCSPDTYQNPVTLPQGVFTKTRNQGKRMHLGRFYESDWIE